MKKTGIAILMLLVLGITACGNASVVPSSDDIKTTESTSGSPEVSSLSEYLKDPEAVKELLPNPDSKETDGRQFELLSVPYETEDEILAGFQAHPVSSGGSNTYCMALIRLEDGKVVVADSVTGSQGELSDKNSEVYQHLYKLVSGKYEEVNRNDTLTQEQLEEGTLTALDTFFKSTALFTAWSEEEKSVLKDHLIVRLLPSSAVPFDPFVWVWDTSIHLTDRQFLIGIRPDDETLQENIKTKCAGIWGGDFRYVPMTIVFKNNEVNAGIATDLFGLLDDEFDEAQEIPLDGLLK